ncbi:transposase [Amycolatopsis sp. CM201R]|nr:transposase [Amycolatopsis sp. 505]MDS0146783.1 transposase [Amycolatopsis sp. CM201R]
MGRVGSCYDNAVAEAFFATLKTEIGVSIWRTRTQARQDVFTWLHYYNHTRLHSTNGHHTQPKSEPATVNPQLPENPVSASPGQLQTCDRRVDTRDWRVDTRD